MFAFIMFYVATQINSMFSTATTDSSIDSLKLRANTFINLLVKDSGDPVDWETDIETVNRIGLATEPYHLSKAKLTALDENCDLLRSYNLSGYKLAAYDDTGEILSCGFSGLSPIQTYVIRYVYIDGGYGNITFELW